MSDVVPDVSVIVRSMARPTLGAALASLADQRGPIEVLVVAAAGPTHPGLDDRCGTHALRLVRTESPLSRSAAANAGLDGRIAFAARVAASESPRSAAIVPR